MSDGPDKPADQSPESPSIAGAMAWSSIHVSLTSLARRARLVLVAQRVAFILAVTLGIAIGLALLDYALRVPGWLRTITLPAWIVLLAVVWRRWVIPAWRFRPTMTDVALRVERALPELKGRLGSAMDLGEGRGSIPTTNSRAMADAVVRSVAGQWGGRDAASLVRTDGARRSGSWLLAAATVCLGLFIWSPTMWWTGAQRVLVPWSGAAWPKRTAIADATDLAVHPLGESLPFRAVLTRSAAAAESVDVYVEYRFLTDGTAGGWRKELLTWQNRDGAAHTQTVDALGRVQKSEVTGPLFERLIDPAGDTIEYRVSSSDDDSGWKSIRIVPPPALVSASAVITPPAYAPGEPVTAELGAGIDERAVAPMSLAGSTVRLALTLNKDATFEPGLIEQLRLMGGEQAAASATLSGSGKNWVLQWAIAQPTRLLIRPVDELGIAAAEEAVLRFDAIEDKPAEATITEPNADRGVLATALVNVTAEGRDDVGLSYVSLERVIARPAGREGGEKSGPGGALEPVGPAEVIERVSADGKQSASAKSAVDIAVLEVKPGDEVRLTAVAADVFASAAEQRSPSRSQVRTLRIISEAEFVKDVQRELAAVRQAAIRIDTQQGEVAARTLERGADKQARRGQAQVSERVQREGENIQRVADRVQENGLMDQGLGEMLRQAKEALEQAGKASADAGEKLDEASADQPEPTPGEQDAAPVGGEKAKQAAAPQQDVRDNMQRLAEMLDKGQDNWVVKNKLEQLIKTQNQLREQTRELGSQTAGKNASELSQEQKRAAEAIAEKQQQLADEVAKLAKSMREKAQELAKTDAPAAKGMQDAADRAEQQQIAETMKSAASSANQNRMNDAGQRQEQAAAAMQKMMEDMESGEKQRAMVLKRKLDEIAAAIEKLVARQQQELEALDAAQKAQDGYAGLDRGMISLNQNTLGVSDQARSSEELAAVARLLGKASDAQGSAVGGLRASSVDPEPVRRDENESLDALKTALERAQQLSKTMEKQEEQQKLAELKTKYKQILDRQVAVRAQTSGFAELKELSRRDRVLVRKLGEGQTQVRDDLATLREESKDLKDTTVFDFAHKRLGDLTTGAGTALDRADAPAALRPQDGAVATLKGIIDALTDPKKESKFNESAGAAGGGGGGGGGGKKPLIPPAKEIRLLRMLQADLARQTNEASNAGDNAAASDIARQQRDIAAVGERLLKKVASGTGGGEPEIPFGPAPEPQPEDAPPGGAQPPVEPQPEPAQPDPGVTAIPNRNSPAPLAGPRTRTIPLPETPRRPRTSTHVPAQVTDAK